MTHLMVALLSLDVLMTSLLALVLWHVLHRLDLVSDHLRQVMKQTESSVVKAAGGRAFPTPDDLAAARSRIDQVGTARPGGPS